jgi:hypothetical protein
VRIEERVCGAACLRASMEAGLNRHGIQPTVVFPHTESHIGTWTGAVRFGVPLSDMPKFAGLTQDHVQKLVCFGALR